MHSGLQESAGGHYLKAANRDQHSDSHVEFTLANSPHMGLWEGVSEPAENPHSPQEEHTNSSDAENRTYDLHTAGQQLTPLPVLWHKQ